MFLRNFILSVFFILSYTISTSALESSVTLLKYYTEQQGSYLEIYSRISSGSVQYIDNYAALEVTMLIEQGTDIVTADKYKLTSPASTDLKDFWDLKRIQITNGKYRLKVQYVDLNNPIDTLLYESTVIVNYSDNSPVSSDVLLFSDMGGTESTLAFQKSGFSYEPKPYNLFSGSDTTLYFYTEVYNLSQVTEDLYIKYGVREVESQAEMMPSGYKRLSSTMNPALVLKQVDISKLKSGNYEFQLEIVNKQKDVLYYKAQNFAVSNIVMDFNKATENDAAFATAFVQNLSDGELNYALKAIYPRVGNGMTESLNELVWSEDTVAKRYFLYSFWTGFSKDNPQKVFEQYMSVAQAIDRQFKSNLGHGFESDRGYFFLKYGKPDDVITVEDEQDSPPYEIWYYNHLIETNQTGVKFLFYNPTLGAKEFVLLHSTCRGENSNPNWESTLYGERSNIQDKSSIDGFNRNAMKLFNDF